MKLKYLTLLLAVLMLTSCERLFIKKDPPNTFVGNFETFWNQFDQHYVSFASKGLDWDAVYNQYRPRVDKAQSEEEFFSILAEMTLLFEDGHVNLRTPDSTVKYNFTEGFPENSPKFARNRLKDRGDDLNEIIHYGDITGTNIGYIYIKDFQSDPSDYTAINDIFPWIESKEAMIFDIRSNGGGKSNNAVAIASRFASSSQVYATLKGRNGARHDDFTKPKDISIAPSGSTFTKPVAILTNKATYSTAEAFTYILKVFDNVTTVGGITGGGEGNPEFRVLPNGWLITIPFFLEKSKVFGNFEGVGLPPDHPVDITVADIASETDAILEKAIEVLQ